MKQRKIILLLVAFFSAVIHVAAQDTRIVTSRDTYVLTPPEKCINSTCLNGIVRIAQLAGPALAADVNTAKNEATKLNGDLKSAATAYEAARSEYSTAKAPYDAKLADYTKDWSVHDRDVQANNAKKPEDRNAAEVDRLNRSKASLDSRKAVLDAEMNILMEKWQDLQQKKNDVNAKAGQVQAVTDKLTSLLEQLELCKQFGKRALSVSKEKHWGNYQTVNDFFGTLKIVPSIGLLNSGIEQMRAWIGKVWD